MNKILDKATISGLAKKARAHRKTIRSFLKNNGSSENLCGDIGESLDHRITKEIISGGHTEESSVPKLIAPQRSGIASKEIGGHTEKLGGHTEKCNEIPEDDPRYRLVWNYQ